MHSRQEHDPSTLFSGRDSSGTTYLWNALYQLWPPVFPQLIFGFVQSVSRAWLVSRLSNGTTQQVAHLLTNLNLNCARR